VRDRHHRAALLGQLVASQLSDGMMAPLAAYALLPLNRQPIGSGPYRCQPGCLRDDGSVRLAPFDAYHGGRAAASAVDLRYSAEYPPGPLVADGEVDWVRYLPSDDPTLETGNRNLKLPEYVNLAYFALQYNVRDGALFADPNLRQAMRLCVGKERTVADATLGHGVPIETPIPPASWAHHPDLPHVERDVDAARRLIESSGWTMGDDGVYLDAEGCRLATEVWVRAGRPDWLAFAESLAEQLADCGIELEPVAADHILLLGSGGLLQYPHVPPAARDPGTSTSAAGATMVIPTCTPTSTPANARPRSSRPRSTTSATRMCASTGCSRRRARRWTSTSAESSTSRFKRSCTRTSHTSSHGRTSEGRRSTSIWRPRAESWTSTHRRGTGSPRPSSSTSELNAA
jgi:hypothetical protein